MVGKHIGGRACGTPAWLGSVLTVLSARGKNKYVAVRNLDYTNSSTRISKGVTVETLFSYLIYMYYFPFYQILDQDW